MSTRIKGVGLPGKMRAAGTIYEDGQTGILYVQNQSPFGSNWTPLDTNYLDDSTGGSSTFTGGTIAGATNFTSTISSGGTNLYSIFALAGSSSGSFTGGTIAGATNFTSTISSGGTNLNTLFASSSHTHPISGITNLQSTLDTKAPITSPEFLSRLSLGTAIENANAMVYGNITGKNIFAEYGFIPSYVVLSNKNLNVDITDYKQTIYATNNSIVTLPSTPIGGMVLTIKNDVTLGRSTQIESGGRSIDGSVAAFILSNAGQSVTLQYFDTVGWLIIGSYSGFG